jgi:acyl-CoA reductase-like NAD-dependent aldehyde dehydrogenase
MQAVLKNFINGRWETAATTGISENPSDLAAPVAEYARADERQARLAVEAARESTATWAIATPQRRADALDQVGSELLARKDELGELLAREEGKTRPEAVAEAARAGQIFKFFAGEALRVRGDRVASVRPDIEVDVTREPVGVVGVIAPWNFPLAIPAWKIAPALAYGNAVVFKPAELVPACGWALAEILSRAGLPAGVFNLVNGSGRQVGQALAESPGVDAITFTGSGNTGAQVLKQATQRGAKVQLEMGGKNPLVVLEDADMDRAVECAVNGAFFSTGQRCTASSRIIVDRKVHDRFVAAMRARMKKLKVGPALTPGTDIGPVASLAQLEQNQTWLEIGRQQGAEHIVGGQRVECVSKGHFMTPALFLAAPEHRIAREEIFGPVATVLAADDYEHALALANDTEYGLCAGIVTTSLKHATHFKRHAKAGMVMVNLATAGVDYHVPFGGRKGSSYGPREQGTYAAEFYTIVKTAYTCA